MTRIFRAVPVGRSWGYLATALLIYAFSNSPVNAQLEEIDYDQWKNDYHGFALLCRSQDLVIHSDKNEWSKVPINQRLLICFGNCNIVHSQLRAFIQNGGSVLWASDFATRFPTSMGISIRGRVYQARRNDDAYLGERVFPYADALTNQHPVTRGIDRIVTNLPSTIDVSNQFEFSKANWWTLLKTRRSRSNTLLIAGQFARNSNVIIAADHSIFTNQMLTVGDNSKLAMQCIQWLRQGKRTDAIIFVDGEVVQPADLMELEVPLPQPTKEQVIEIFKQIDPALVLEFANSAAAEIEDSDIHNQVIPAMFEAIPRRYYSRFLIFATTIFFAFIIGRNLFVRRNRAIQSADDFYVNQPGGDDDNSNPANQPVKLAKKSQLKRQQSLERQQIAELLLEKYFRFIGIHDAMNIGYRDFRSQIRAMRSSDLKTNWEILKYWRRANLKPAGFWTFKRLTILKNKIEAWRQLQNNRVVQ